MKKSITQKSGLMLGCLAFGLVSSLHAQNLITNGDFEDVLYPGYAAQLHIPDQFNFDGSPVGDAISPGGAMSQGIQQVTGWQTEGYNFLMTPGSATSGGAGSAWNDYVTFYGTPTQTPAQPPEEVGGLSETPIPATSPSGGNFLALDSAYYFGRNWEPYNEEPISMVRPIWQEVSGLEVGQEYELVFYWAAAQQVGFDGDTWDQLNVSFGDETYSTDVINLPEHTFQDWMQETVRFTATATTQVLSFLADGGPDGQPPFVFLDGVSMEAVPEPGNVALISLASLGLIMLRRRRS